MCDQKEKSGIQSMAPGRREPNFGAIDEKFHGLVVKPEKGFYLKSGGKFVGVQRRTPSPCRRAERELMGPRDKKPGVPEILGIYINKDREVWHGFKNQQELSNWYHAVRRFAPNMHIELVEVREVHAHVEVLSEEWPEDEENC